LQRSKDSISQKVELCETAFIHAIPFQQRARGKILKQEKMVRRKQKTEKEV
jgi:hypothetical protein